jgi:hypothetical protein
MSRRNGNYIPSSLEVHRLETSLGLPCTSGDIPDIPSDRSIPIGKQLEIPADFEERAARLKTRIDAKWKSCVEEAETYVSSLKIR